MKIQISTSADKSGIIRQLQELKVDNSNEGTGIRNMLLGTEAAFTYEGPKNFRASIPKPISATYKRKYPDLVFALHALRLHLGGNTYYREWEKAKKFLTFKTKEYPRTLYRFWHLGTHGSGLKEDALDLLREGKSIKLKETEEYASYTRNNELFTRLKSGQTRMNIATEEALQTKGRGTFLVTKHTLIPVFDIYWFLLALKKASKEILGTEFLPTKYLQEREIIAKSVTEIKPSDVVCYYKNAQRFQLHDKILNVLGYDLAPEMIDTIKESANRYKEVDLSLFGHSLIITSVTTKTPGSMYNYISNKSEIVEVPELSKVCGIKVYAGIWK